MHTLQNHRGLQKHSSEFSASSEAFMCKHYNSDYKAWLAGDTIRIKECQGVQINSSSAKWLETNPTLLCFHVI